MPLDNFATFGDDVTLTNSACSSLAGTERKDDLPFDVKRSSHNEHLYPAYTQVQCLALLC